MKLKALAVSLTALLGSALVSTALAAPVPYTFATGVLSANNPFNLNGAPPTPEQWAATASIASVLGGTTVSGSFLYDSAGQLTGATNGGPLGTRGSVYSGYTLPDGVTPHSSYSGLSASVNGGTPRPITDPRGRTIVGDNAYQFACFTPGCTPTMVDFLQLQAEPGSGTGTRNLTGFDVGDYALFNVRLFWLETQAVPTPVPDLFDSQNLPNTPPTMNGRLALDFVHAATDPLGTATHYIVFYDNLFVTAAIPEPETYALLLTGLALLGFAARRRTRGSCRSPA